MNPAATKSKFITLPSIIHYRSDTPLITRCFWMLVGFALAFASNVIVWLLASDIVTWRGIYVGIIFGLFAALALCCVFVGLVKGADK